MKRLVFVVILFILTSSCDETKKGNSMRIGALKDTLVSHKFDFNYYYGENILFHKIEIQSFCKEYFDIDKKEYIYISERGNNKALSEGISISNNISNTQKYKLKLINISIGGEYKYYLYIKSKKGFDTIMISQLEGKDFPNLGSMSGRNFIGMALQNFRFTKDSIITVKNRVKDLYGKYLEKKIAGKICFLADSIKIHITITDDFKFKTTKKEFFDNFDYVPR